jgi:hypothetical protein
VKNERALNFCFFAPLFLGRMPATIAAGKQWIKDNYLMAI